MAEVNMKEYQELKARDEARKERARLQGARNRARMAFYKKFFEANAKKEDREALSQAVATI